MTLRPRFSTGLLFTMGIIKGKTFFCGIFPLPYKNVEKYKCLAGDVSFPLLFFSC